MEKSSNNPARFSFFPKPIRNIIPSARFTLADAYRYITSPMARQATHELRLQSNVQDARIFKAANFDYVTFSGLFSKRNEKAQIAHSGLLCLDFDHLENLDKVRWHLLNDEYFETQLLFTSPSGHGLKWVIEINLATASHLDYFNGVSNYLKQTYNLSADPSGKDTCRACFLPHDPNCYINPKQL